MSLSRDTIEGALRDALVSALGLHDEKVVHDKQNSPRPQEPYAVLNVWTASARKGMDEDRLSDDSPGVIEHTGSRRLTVSVNVYGPYSIEGAERAAERMLGETIGEHLLTQAGISVIDRTPVRDLSEMLETRWQERAQFDLVVGAVSSWTEDVGWIESVELQAELQAGGVVIETDPVVIDLEED